MKLIFIDDYNMYSKTVIIIIIIESDDFFEITVLNDITVTTMVQRSITIIVSIYPE